MIISHTHRFIFIKTRKTAGTSVETYLSELCGSEDVFPKIYPAEQGHTPRNFAGLFNPIPDLLSSLGDSALEATRPLRDLRERRKFWNHMPARYVRSRIGAKVWDSYYKFCFEREPMSKTRSHYQMMVREGKAADLNSYFERGKFASDWHLYTDDAGKVIVDDVFRFETINEDLGKVFDRLNIPFSGQLTTKTKVASDAPKPKAPFEPTDAQKDRLRDVFASEIEAFGTTF